MKIGVMNNPRESIYEETAAFGKADFDFIDLTIEGPRAREVDITRMTAILEQYNLTVIGHTDPCLPWAYPVRTIRWPVSMNSSAVPGSFLPSVQG